jgi:DNA-directed RNA polymerase specialized sigma24 family protein
LSGQVARLIDLQDAVAARIAACESRIAHAVQAVDALPGAQRIVMRLRYFEGYGWQQVARAMHYTIRRCLQFHNEAERMLEAAFLDCPPAPYGQFDG